DPEDALGSQNPLILSQDYRWLFAVNAASNTITMFEVLPNSLDRVATVPSGGEFPTSLTVHDNLLYVLNAGGRINIAGFTIDESARTLRYLSGSVYELGRTLSNRPGITESPGQVGFTPYGDRLVVTEKGADEIHVFDLDAHGRPSARRITPSLAPLPFGFSFSNTGRLIVAEPFGQQSLGSADAGAVSAYTIRPNGRLRFARRSETVSNGQTTTCWVAAAPGSRWSYTTNNGASTVSLYRSRPGGRVLLQNAVAGHTQLAPVDLTVVPTGDFLYTLNAGAGSISMFEITRSTGALDLLGHIGGLPAEAGIVGIAAF
ncbi:MAG: beta-propeller fold lactonase family protein, partial [Myxococcota bacterium]